VSQATVSEATMIQRASGYLRNHGRRPTFTGHDYIRDVLIIRKPPGSAGHCFVILFTVLNDSLCMFSRGVKLQQSVDCICPKPIRKETVRSIDSELKVSHVVVSGT
jgi:hypothetical protein